MPFRDRLEKDPGLSQNMREFPIIDRDKVLTPANSSSSQPLESSFLSRIRNPQCECCCNIIILQDVITSEGHKKYIPYTHQRSFQSLLASASTCNLCELFRDRLINVCISQQPKAYRDGEFNEAGVFIFTDEQLEWGQGKISTSEIPVTTHLTVKLISQSLDGKQKIQAEVSLGYIIYKKPSSGVVGRPISADPRSSFPLQLMDTWIRECVSNHAECRNFRNEFFPTRVLNVSLGNLSNDPFLQVSDGRIQDKYLVLSHCWGSAPSLTTTTANLEIRKKSIPIESMPANFRDAVWLTRKLGVHHLWIDSLCILQDSTLDWQVESECMGDVYANAFLTIAADNAKNSSEGFLKKRPEGVVDPIINVSCLSADGTRFNDLALREYPATWKYGVNKAVLNERGWALQERVMSTRILHFGEQQLYWECRQVTDAEGGMYFYPHDTSVFSKAQLRDIWNEEEQGSYADELERWYTCLDEYSTRKLTYGKDKLPAIAGIAKSMQNRTPELGAYYAGIWKGDFVRGLLWRAKRIGGLAQLGEYRAPSWSWAALDGPMKHDWFALKYFDPDKFPTIEDVSIRCLGRSDFGEIHSGWVRIKAPMCPAVYLGTPARGVLDIIGPFGEPLQTGNDTENQYHDLYHFGPTSWEPIGPPICCAYFDTPLEVGKLKPFTLMRLGDFSSFIRPDNWWDLASWNSNPWALILDDAGSENGESVHKRVGIARMNDKNAFRGWGALSKKII